MFTALIEAIRHVADMIHEHTREVVKFDNEWLAYNKARDEQETSTKIEYLEKHVKAEREVQKTTRLVTELEILRALNARGLHDELLKRVGIDVPSLPEEQQEEVSNPDGRD